VNIVVLTYINALVHFYGKYCLMNSVSRETKISDTVLYYLPNIITLPLSQKIRRE